MPGSGPPVPDLVLDAIRDGALFARVKEDVGGLDVGGVVHRLAVGRSSSDLRGAWYLDPDAGSYLDAGTFETLRAWSISAERGAPVQFDKGQLFELGLFPDSVEGIPIARVVVTGPAAADRLTPTPAR